MKNCLKSFLCFVISILLYVGILWVSSKISIELHIPDYIYMFATPLILAIIYYATKGLVTKLLKMSRKAYSLYFVGFWALLSIVLTIYAEYVSKTTACTGFCFVRSWDESLRSFFAILLTAALLIVEFIMFLVRRTNK